MLKQKLRRIVSTCFPHANKGTVCPPGPLPTGSNPPIIVSSLMRSGTHLAIDLLLNNLPIYRNHPLYVDFDRYVYEGFELSKIINVGNCIIKTHIQQRPFNASIGDSLKLIASKGLVIIPTRDLSAAKLSLTKWNYSYSIEDLQKDHEVHLDFWKDFFPIIVDFRSLTDPIKASVFLNEVRQRLHLEDDQSTDLPVVASCTEMGIFWSKFQTRLLGSKAKLINTTVGYKI
jgi:hypothetical protein